MGSISSPPPEASETSHLIAVYRRWLRAQSLRSAWTWHRRVQPDETTFGFLSFTVILFMPLDEALWRYQGPFPWLIVAPRSGAVLVATFLCVFAANGFLLHIYLSRRTVDEKDWPLGLLILRALAGGLPLLGLFLVPFWRRQERRSGPMDARWAFEGDLKGLKRSLSGSARWTDPAESRWLIPWMFISGVVVLLVAACWLAKQAALDSRAYRSLIAVSITLHMTVFAAMLAHVRKEASRQRLSRRSSRVLKALPVLWLLPVPYLSLPAVLLHFRINRESAGWESVIFRVWGQAKQAGRLPFWLRFEDRLQLAWPAISLRQRWWSPPRAVDRGIKAGREERQILRLYDLTSYGLGFDAAALAWTLVWLAKHLPGWSGGLARAHWTVLTASLILLAAGLCAGAAHLLLVLLRSPGRLRVLDRHPYALYLVKTQLCLLWGWLMGLVLGTSSPEDAARLLIATGMLLVVLRAISLVLRPALPPVRSHQQRADALPGVVLLFVLVTLGAFGLGIDLLGPTLGIWVLLYPVRALLLGRYLVPWLLRPFEWKDVFASDLSGRLRALLAILAVPAVVPCGGLALPVWIFVRHRWWPWADGLWRERKRNALVS